MSHSKGQQLSSPAQVHPSLTRWLPSDDAVCAKPRNRTGALEGTSTQNQHDARPLPQPIFRLGQARQAVQLGPLRRR